MQETIFRDVYEFLKLHYLDKNEKPQRTTIVCRYEENLIFAIAI